MIFEKIRERLHEQSKKYIESAEQQTTTDYRWMDEMAAQATEEAIDIINQVEAEYTCENCVEKGRCSIYDNTDVKYCADCRPRFKPYKEDDTEGFLNTMQLAEDWNLEITEEQRERLNRLKDRW